MPLKSILLFSLFSFLVGFATVSAQSKAVNPTPKFPMGISSDDLKQAKRLLVISSADIKMPGEVYRASRSFVYAVDPKKINIDSLLKLPEVMFIQPERKAIEEMVLNGSDLTLNAISYAHNQHKNITGKGITVSVKEDRPDTIDIDFRKRYINTGLESSTLSSHATTMFTLIGGGGNTFYTGKGAAYKANLSSVSFQVLLPEQDSIYRKYKTSVQNHSYGTGIENFYGADSWAYDASVNTNDSLLHIFSSGNSGNQTSTSGKYAGVTKFANLTGSFKQSKNSLSVGATDSFYHVEVLSSRGPAYDGRIKPELVAFGQDGSSGAAALVSGSALLIQDAYRQSYGKLPLSSLVRAALINAADDLLQPGPDYISGFGSLNTQRAIKQIVNNQFFTGSIANGGVAQFNIVVQPNAKETKITLAWNDIAAAPNASKALVNDLDLEVIELSTGTVFYPLVLSSYPHIDSLNATALQRRDTLNTVEQVFIDLPIAGNYIIRIKGTSVQGTQTFNVVYNTEIKDDFYFTYPTGSDNLVPSASNTIRWQSFANSSATGNLEISYDAGNNWQPLSVTPLPAKYYKAVIKDTITTARLRMTFTTAPGSSVILSDTFTISPRLRTNVGYNCTDSFSFYWNKLPNVNTYTVYALTDTFMRAQFQVTDTFITIHPNSNRHWAVAPNIGNRQGLRSYAFDYATQGAGCFINSFLADLDGDSVVNLKAILGSRYQVQDITFQRLFPTTNLITFSVNRDTFTTIDKVHKEGIYYYRAKLVLKNGSEVNSDIVQVVVFKEKDFFVYPNPYRNGSTLVIQSKDHDRCIFELFTPLGQKVYSYKIKADIENISLPYLQKGIFFYRIVRDDKRISNGKLIIE
jgi:hypothetical protein